MAAMNTGTVHAAQVSNASLRAVNTPKPALMSLPDHQPPATEPTSVNR